MDPLRIDLIDKTGAAKNALRNHLLRLSPFSSSFLFDHVPIQRPIKHHILSPRMLCKSLATGTRKEENEKALAHLVPVKLEMDTIRIALIGKTGVGKSAVGNSILGSSRFSSSFGCNSVTKKCQIEETKRFGRRIVVVDTPGVFDVNASSATATEEIRKAIAHLVPHVFILCIRMGRLTEEDNRVFRQLNYIFGDSFQNHSLILFTTHDSFTNDNRTKSLETKNYLGDFIDSLPDYAMSFIQRFRGRYIAFDNSLQGEKADKQVENILNLLKIIMKENCGRCYTSGVGVERCLRRKHPYDKNKCIIKDGFIKSHGLKI